MTHMLDTYAIRNILLTRYFGGPVGFETHNPRIKRAIIHAQSSLSRRQESRCLPH
jgi:hypothetical protein